MGIIDAIGAAPIVGRFIGIEVCMAVFMWRPWVEPTVMKP
jgi:hypothetical protein